MTYLRHFSRDGQSCKSSFNLTVYAADVIVTYQVLPEKSAWLYANVSDIDQTISRKGLQRCRKHANSVVKISHPARILIIFTASWANLQSDGKAITVYTKLRYIFSRIFPDLKWCKFYAPTVYKYPVLLPFFWVWRLLVKGFKKRNIVRRELESIKNAK